MAHTNNPSLRPRETASRARDLMTKPDGCIRGTGNPPAALKGYPGHQITIRRHKVVQTIRTRKN